MVPELFRHPGGLDCLRPAEIQQHLRQRQQAHAPVLQEPQLLQRLYGCLDEAAVKAALEGGQHSQQRSTAASRQQTTRQLSAYHQVFDLLLGSLTTYRPLLLHIKQAYDAALKDATAATCDNVFLQSKLAEVPHQHAEAIAAAAHNAQQAAAAMELELQHNLAQVEQQTQQAEGDMLGLEQQLHHLQKQMLQARRELDQCEASVRRSHKELLESSSWQMLVAQQLKRP